MADVAPEQLATYFRIADELLGNLSDAKSSMRHDDIRCDGCGSSQLVTSYAQGHFVCYDCALVQAVAVMETSVRLFIDFETKRSRSTFTMS